MSGRDYTRVDQGAMLVGIPWGHQPAREVFYMYVFKC